MVDLASLAELAELANPPYNVLGTTLFLSYIVLALYFTTSITLSLHKQYGLISSLNPPGNKDKKFVKQVKDDRKRHIKIYAFLASISFATLSSHMLMFLITSYAQWNGSKRFELSDVTLESLKTWMLNSSLFESFAKELVRDGPSTAWTQVAILSTWFWNIWMAGKAQRYGFTSKTMIPFVMLSQILPISFTVSLYIIQLHLSALGIAPGPSNPAPQSENNSQSAQPPSKKVYKKSSLTLPTILLNASLLALPPLRNHPAFIPLVLGTRLILLLPYTGRIRLKDQEVVQSISISGGFIVANLAMMRKAVGWRDVLKGLSAGGEAVKALGWDAQVGAVVYAVLSWGGGV